MRIPPVSTATQSHRHRRQNPFHGGSITKIIQNYIRDSPRIKLFSAVPAETEEDGTETAFLQVVGAAGVTADELSSVLEEFRNVFHYVNIPVHYDAASIDSYILDKSERPLTSVHGTLGRVILMELGGGYVAEDTWMEELQASVCETIDDLLDTGVEHEEPVITQPIVVSIQPGSNQAAQELTLEHRLSSILQQQVDFYDLARPLLSSTTKARDSTSPSEAMIPSDYVEIDGAFVDNPWSKEQAWDTSSIVVWDDLVSDDLRERLLDVVLGRSVKDAKERRWNDIEDGPDPERWIRGGLIDVPEDETEEAKDGDGDDEGDPSTSWGLRGEVIEEICFQEHEAIAEFQQLLTDLFPQFIVTRLPEAVFGDTVSPLTANAPTQYDSFDYHIDGDPYLTPPSPWTDIYGRYPNRARGKPRFMSCLVYLNEEWKPEWGASTRFMDPPTEVEHSVVAKPGRVVLMDQDVRHRVTAPTPIAGNRPRYSLVWKLILHPKTSMQDMKELAPDDRLGAWPEPTLFGSADPNE